MNCQIHHTRFSGRLQRNKKNRPRRSAFYGMMKDREIPVKTCDGKANDMNYVYLLRCADGSLYCGWTTDPEARAAAHNQGRGAKYTRSRLPVELVYTEQYEDRHEALSREWHLKRMSHAEKERLIAAGR